MPRVEGKFPRSRGKRPLQPPFWRCSLILDCVNLFTSHHYGWLYGYIARSQCASQFQRSIWQYSRRLLSKNAQVLYLDLFAWEGFGTNLNKQLKICAFLAVTLGRNQPLKKERPPWTSEIPLTEGQLRSKRDEFWETAPAFEGRKEIWDALRAAAETDDHTWAQAIVDGANITLPTGTHSTSFKSTEAWRELTSRQVTQEISWQFAFFLYSFPFKFNRHSYDHQGRFHILLNTPRASTKSHRQHQIPRRQETILMLSRWLLAAHGI